ncbi:MAG TPA: hypothetical protein VLW85_15595 [Myxococcales bacterium]|nr:hypothetical protein [Myxococcales bacterium]
MPIASGTASRSFQSLVGSLFAPLAVIAFALWSWRPARDSFAGFGSDPLFNLWHFEVLWHDLSSRAPILWAPLYGGSPLGLAYSETQLAPGVLLLPLFRLCASSALSLGIAGVLLALLAYFCATAWLRSLGLRELAPWGGLLFACCPWLQSQQAHFQNACIFVLPLAFFCWQRKWLWASGLAFGWIAAWNVYFALFADACLLVWAVREKRPGPLVVAALVQAPLAWPYVQLGSFTAQTTYGATWRSVLGSAHRPRLLLPSFEVPIESAGYLGAAWLLLLLLSLWRRGSRPWVAACAIAFWVALGRGFGLFDALALLPGASGLRAIGRAQVLVVAFSLPAVLGLLQSLPRRWAAGALALVCLDWLPAGPPDRVQLPPRLQLPALDEAMLVWPPPDAGVMLQLAPSFTPYYGGYSGRTPPGEELLGSLSLPDALAFTCARRLLQDGRLSEVSVADAPALLLDRDAEMIATGRAAAELRALRDGVLDIRAVDRCRLRQTALGIARTLPLQGLRGVRFRRGEVILRVEAKQWIWRALGAAVRFGVRCPQA